MSLTDDAASRALPDLAHGSKLVADAFRFALEAHEGSRSRGDTHIDHPLEVARLLAGAGYPEHVIAAALLHDVVEDTAIPIAEIRNRFGARVATLVAKVTENPTIDDYGSRKAALRTQAAGDGEQAAAIFAADKLANARKLRFEDEAVDSDKLQHYEGTLELLLTWHPEVPFINELAGELLQLRTAGDREPPPAPPTGVNRPLPRAPRDEPDAGAGQRFLLLRWSAAPADPTHTEPPNSSRIMSLKSAVEDLGADGEPAGDGDGATDRDEWRSVLMDLDIGDYFSVEHNGGGYVYARRLTDSP